MLSSTTPNEPRASFARRARAWLTRAIPVRPGARDAWTPAMLERLEGRVLLDGTPLPALSSLESQANSVIRFETTYGDVDIELFNSIAPNTVANFVRYITSGRLDDSFFHRVVVFGATGPNGQPNQLGVVQGGGFTFENATGLTQVTTDAPIAFEQTNRPNVERTIAMARTNDPDSATCQFFFNLVDNSSVLRLTPNDNGFVVFGNVIQGWSVIQTIYALQILDLRADPALAGPAAGNFQTTPVTASYSPAAGVRDNALVTLVNAELIKPAGSNDFYAQRLVYPEGHRTDTSNETINLFNPNGAPATYQLIARYETGLRDVVIQSGTIAANSKLEIQLSRAGQAAPDLVRRNAPYSLTLETSVPIGTTTPRPITATLDRVDFGGATSERFFEPAQFAEAALRTWSFARVERTSQSREFLTWMNLTDDTHSVTITLVTQGTTRTFVFDVGPYRRGGMEVFNASLADNVYAARVSSTGPVVAALADYDLPSAGVAPDLAETPAWAVLGTPGGGSITGVLAGAEILPGFDTIVSIDNPNSTVAVVTLRLWRTSRAPQDPPIQPPPLIVFPSGRLDFNLTTALGIAERERFTITYESLGAPVTLQYTSVDASDRNGPFVTRDDGVSMAFSLGTGTEAAFADGLIDPDRDSSAQSEVLSLFSPFANSAISLAVTARARFSDGTEVVLGSAVLTNNQRLDLAVDANTDVRAKALSGAQFRSYAIIITGNATGPNNTQRAIAPIAQLVRRDQVTGHAVTLSPLALGTLTNYNDPVFTPGGSL